MAEIEFHQVGKMFDGGTMAVRDFNLRTTDGELLVLVGPSGCGKSTLLRMVAGLEEISAGEIRIGGQVVNNQPPQRRNVAMVFQNYALYPHMTVRKNLAFPLKTLNVPRAEIERRVRATAELLGIQDLLDRRPRQLSGGQRQRVAMGRALVREPAVFLMDEPLSNLDAKLRVQMRGEITALQRRLGTTTIFVTHDQVEAMTMGDRLAVLNHGQLQQVGAPEQIYDHPANIFVATFIGSPAMNLFWSTLEANGGGQTTVRFGEKLLPLAVPQSQGNLKKWHGQQVICGLRPEAFCPADRVPATQQIVAQIERVELMGHEEIVHFRTNVPSLVAEEIEQLSPESLPSALRGESPSAKTAVFAARMAPSATIGEGQSVTLGIDTRRVHLFDPAGNAIGIGPKPH
jgi:multiple sugar transport system ATP-binding protein